MIKIFDSFSLHLQQSTVKLVATSMIAAGKVSEGCQLLCLINKALDACRYMQTYGQWHQAIWLAKSTLEESDSAQVLKRYVDHLCSANVNLKSYAILVSSSVHTYGDIVISIIITY